MYISHNYYNNYSALF